MNPQTRPLVTALTYAGGLPFVACAAAALAGARPLGLDPIAVARAYSLVIAGFMAGAVWGTAIPRAGAGLALIALSNVLALAVFFAALAPSPRVTLGFDLLAFLALLAVDAWARRLGWLSADYLRLRMRITALVAASLAVAWAAA